MEPKLSPKEAPREWLEYLRQELCRALDEIQKFARNLNCWNEIRGDEPPITLDDNPKFLSYVMQRKAVVKMIAEIDRQLATCDYGPIPDFGIGEFLANEDDRS